MLRPPKPQAEQHYRLVVRVIQAVVFRRLLDEELDDRDVPLWEILLVHVVLVDVHDLGTLLNAKALFLQRAIPKEAWKAPKPSAKEEISLNPKP